ncbi:MAG: cell division ATP-binding protein FtsE [Calditrichae bacterium]|nr:cell division ATP-binding protein FtsE [candidate division KSB1 bacterium]NIV71733.1 cell division ATP-binding protein FtsE [Calditrichia bacterium]
MIQLYNVFKSYNNNPALVDISFIIKEGAFVFVSGPSGAGKSTLLKLLYRWENYDKGQILVNGINIGKLKFNKLWQLRRHIGVVFQDYKLIHSKTILENVAFALEILEEDKKTIKYKAWEALKNVGLSHKKDSYPLQLSGGEQQRVAIARALVNSPKILLADEPTGNLDPEMSSEILALFEKANKEGTTVVLATHSNTLLQEGNHALITLKRGKIADTRVVV